MVISWDFRSDCQQNPMVEKFSAWKEFNLLLFVSSSRSIMSSSVMYIWNCILSLICFQCNFDEWTLLFSLLLSSSYLVILSNRYRYNNLHAQTCTIHSIENEISNREERIYSNWRYFVFIHEFSLEKESIDRPCERSMCGVIVKKAEAAVAITINLLAPAWTITIKICYCPAATAQDWARTNNDKETTASNNTDWFSDLSSGKISVFLFNYRVLKLRSASNTHTKWNQMYVCVWMHNEIQFKR